MLKAAGLGLRSFGAPKVANMRGKRVALSTSWGLGL